MNVILISTFHLKKLPFVVQSKWKTDADRIVSNPVLTTPSCTGLIPFVWKQFLVFFHKNLFSGHQGFQPAKTKNRKNFFYKLAFTFHLMKGWVRDSGRDGLWVWFLWRSFTVWDRNTDIIYHSLSIFPNTWFPLNGVRTFQSSCMFS